MNVLTIVATEDDFRTIVEDVWGHHADGGVLPGPWPVSLSATPELVVFPGAGDLAHVRFVP